MPVNTPSTDYKNKIEQWHKMRYVMEGQEAVKRAGPEILPCPAGMDTASYEIYKSRPVFYEATKRTAQYLWSCLFKKMPSHPSQGREAAELESVTHDQLSATEFCYPVAWELIWMGTVGIMIDTPLEKGKPYVCYYKIEDIIDFEQSTVNGQGVLTKVRLREYYEEIEGGDEFSKTKKEQYRVLRLDDNGKYVQQLYRGNGVGESASFVQHGDDIRPAFSNGEGLNYIPFYIVSDLGIKNEYRDSILLPMANANIAHYLASADLEYGRHLTGLPQPWAAGFNIEGSIIISPSKVWTADDVKSCGCGFLEFTGTGLVNLENSIKEKEMMMAVLGARMIETPKLAVESGDTLRTRYAAEHNVLSMIAKTLSNTLSFIFSELLKWRGFPRAVDFQINTDFLNSEASSEWVKSLTDTHVAGGISFDTLFYNFKRGGIYPDDIDLEKERAAIEAEKEKGIGMPDGAFPEPDDEDAADEDEGLSDEKEEPKKEEDIK